MRLLRGSAYGKIFKILFSHLVGPIALVLQGPTSCQINKLEREIDRILALRLLRFSKPL
jgi:hypothetical protein